MSTSVKLPPGIHKKLNQFSEEFPRDLELGNWKIIGHRAIVLDDGKVYMRVENTETGVRRFRSIRALRTKRSQNA